MADSEDILIVQNIMNYNNNNNKSKRQNKVTSNDLYDKPSTSKQCNINICENDDTNITPGKENYNEDLIDLSDDSDILVCDSFDELHKSFDSNFDIVTPTPSSSLIDINHLQSMIKENIGLKVLFKNHFCEPLTFLLLLHDFSLEFRLTKVIMNCGGVVYNHINDVDGFTIVLVKDDSVHWSYAGPVFNVSFINACFESKKIVSIKHFFKSSAKIQYAKNFDFMNVVYFKNYTWDKVPDKFIVKYTTVNNTLKKKELVSRNPDVITVLCDSDSNSVDEDKKPKTKSNSSVKVNKNTRQLYSQKEDEDIVKYIIKKKMYSSLKGNKFWKTMENKNVCPQRTWQSLKEHFRKKLFYNLDLFKFLSKEERELLQTSYI